MRQREKALLAGREAQAQSLALSGDGKLLVLLLEFAGTDVTTWSPGDIWDPYGIVEIVGAEYLGDCTNVITETTEFTYTGPLHNEIPRPATAEDADWDFWTEDFGDDHYYDMVFGDGELIQYTAENGDPITVDLTGVSMRLYYEEQSKGKYTVGGDIVGWIPVSHSEAFCGADLSWVKVRIYNEPDTFTSKMMVDKQVASPGDILTYTIVLKDASGTDPDTGFRCSYAAWLWNEIPTGTTYVPGSLKGAGARYSSWYDRVQWQGGLGGKELSTPDHILSFQVRVNDDVPRGTIINDTAVVWHFQPGLSGYLPRRGSYDLTASTRIE